VILTDDDKAQAKELGLTQEELRFAKAAHVAPERYAYHKAAIQAGRDAESALMEEFTEAATEGLSTAYHRPGEEEPPEGQLSRKDMLTLTPEQRTKAREDGRLDWILGINRSVGR